MDQLGKSVNTTGRVPQKLVKLTNLKVIRLKLRKVAKNLQTSVWWEGGGGGGKFVPPPHKPLWNFATLRCKISVSFQQITFKLGNFTNFKGLFPDSP